MFFFYRIWNAESRGRSRYCKTVQLCKMFILAPHAHQWWRFLIALSKKLICGVATCASTPFHCYWTWMYFQWQLGLVMLIPNSKPIWKSQSDTCQISSTLAVGHLGLVATMRKPLEHVLPALLEAKGSSPNGLQVRIIKQIHISQGCIVFSTFLSFLD